MKNVSIHYTYESSPCHNALLMNQATVHAHVQIAEGHAHFTLDYDENFVSHVCIYQVSWKKSISSLCMSSLLGCFSFSNRLTLPLMMSLLPSAWQLGGSSFGHVPVEFSAVLSTAQTPTSLQRLCSFGFTFQCIFLSFLCFSVCFFVPWLLTPPHLTLESYPLWRTASAFETLHIWWVHIPAMCHL